MDRVIAIDGPSGVGKSSLARALAERLDWTYLDTGAMYRLVTLAWLRADRQPELLQDETWLQQLDLDLVGRIARLGGSDVSCEIRSREVTAAVSFVSAQPSVRALLTRKQREIGCARPSILDGRDIGTIVFPNAFLKVFLTASPQVRAERRWLELGGDACEQSLVSILADQEARDQKDGARVLAPLRAAEDALHINTNDQDIATLVHLIKDEVARRLEGEV